MSARPDPLAVIDAFAAIPAQVCCGMGYGGGMDGEGNGEPPSCCNQPYHTDDLIAARADIAALVEADREYNKALGDLMAAESPLFRHVAVATDVLQAQLRVTAAQERRAAALAAFGDSA